MQYVPLPLTGKQNNAAKQYTMHTTFVAAKKQKYARIRKIYSMTLPVVAGIYALVQIVMKMLGVIIQNASLPINARGGMNVEIIMLAMV